MRDTVLDAVTASFDPQLVSHGVWGLVVHFGLAAAIWTILFLGVRTLLRRRAEPRTVKLRRGSVMVETLIVFPVLLLLISGLSQLTLLNVASLLGNLAGYNAGRAVWVWDAQGASDAECEERAIDAAAHAVVPSVPDDFVGASGTREGDAPSLNFASAYDTGRDIERRADGKLAFARQSIDIQVIRGVAGAAGPGRAGAVMTYHFHIAFPWFNYMFGEPAEVGGRRGYFAPIRRNYTLPRQPS
jgi:hypothetical protein